MISSSPEPRIYVPQPLCDPSSLCGYCNFMRAMEEQPRGEEGRGYPTPLNPEEDANARQ